jgi:very-short-patch-repair endonuclease
MRETENSALARRLRRTANAPEAAAWKTLRTLRQHGVVVRRQHPVGGYVVDFAIVVARLIIEIDGAIHRLPDVERRDAERQRAIEAQGWRVVRVSPDIALSPDHLLAIVQRELGI